MRKFILIGAPLAIVALPIAYYLISPLWRDIEVNEALPQTETSTSTTMVVGGPEMVTSEPMPSQPTIISQADFVPSAHEVTGKALLVKTGDKYTVRFENFETVNGPDVDIYLSSDLTAKDYVNLGDIKATKGNVNYAVPAGTDLVKYNKVLVWCQDFSVLFSYAELK